MELYSPLVNGWMTLVPGLVETYAGFSSIFFLFHSSFERFFLTKKMFSVCPYKSTWLFMSFLVPVPGK